MALPHLHAAGYIGETVTADEQEWLVKVVAAVRTHVSYAAQIVDHVDVFFRDEFDFESEEARQVLLDPDIPRVLADFRTKLTGLDSIDAASVQAVLKSITKELKLGGKKVFMPVRVALTGKMHGPELIDIIPLLGKERTLARIAATFAKVTSAN